MTDIDSIIKAAADKYGVSSEALRAIAKIESNNNPLADNQTSSAGGLFQFTDGTASGYGLTGNSRYEAAAAADAAARLARDNAAALSKALGRAPTPAELYLAHQQGAAGAKALLANPGASAVDVLEKVYGSREKAIRAILQNGGTATMTAGDFSKKWTDKADKVLGTLPKSAIEYNSEGKPIDPKTGFLMDKADPRYEAAMTRVAPGSPKPMPQSAASAARARAADIAKRTGGLSPTERAEAKAGLSGGMSPTARDEARAPVAAPARPVATGGLSPDARDEAKAAMLKPTKLNNEKPVVASAPMDGVGPGATFKGVQAFAASGKPAAASGGYKTTGAVAGSVQMPSGARPSSVPAPVKTGGKSPTERDEAKVAGSPKPATIAGPAGMKPLAAPAPLKTSAGSPSYKNVSVLNPAYDEWAKKYGDGSQIQTAATGGMITKDQLAAIQSTGGVPKPAAASAPKAPPKYIQKRVAVPGAAARPVQRPAPAVAPKVSIAAQQAASIAKQERDNAMGAGGNAEDRRAYQQKQHDQAMYGNITRSLL